jgi:hypothetical protein
MSRFASTSVAMVLTAATLGGCTAATVKGSDVGYISNPQEEVFVEVPKEWKQYTLNPYNEFAESADNARIKGLERNPGAWVRIADADPTPSERHADATSPEYPVVSLSVFDLPTDWRAGTGGRDGISIATLRELGGGEIGAPEDPVGAFVGGDPTVEIISYSDQFLADARVWGGHLRMSYRYQTDPVDANLDRWATIDYWGLVDVGQSKLYRLSIKCSAPCFVKNRAQLDKISSSFRIKGQNVPRVSIGKSKADDLVVTPPLRSATEASASPATDLPKEPNS